MLANESPYGTLLLIVFGASGDLIDSSSPSALFDVCRLFGSGSGWSSGGDYRL